MARINIEDAIFRDHRFLTLAIKLGDPDRALGALVRAWCLAQKWYTKSEDRRIPIDDWHKQLLPKELLETGLVESNGQSVRVAGADEQFSWLLERAEAGRAGGRKSAESRKARYGTAQPPPKQSFEDTEAKLRDSRSKTKQTEASFSISSSFSSSLSSSGSNSISEERRKGQPELPSVVGGVQLVADPSMPMDTAEIRSPNGQKVTVKFLPNLMIIWNDNCGSLAKCAAMNKSREAKWRARWNERPDQHYWEATIQRLSESPFANGSNDRGWRASVDFLLQAESHLKINEGKYDNRSRGPVNAGLAQLVREGKV